MSRKVKLCNKFSNGNYKFHNESILFYYVVPKIFRFYKVNIVNIQYYYFLFSQYNRWLQLTAADKWKRHSPFIYTNSSNNVSKTIWLGHFVLYDLGPTNWLLYLAHALDQLEPCILEPFP